MGVPQLSAGAIVSVFGSSRPRPADEEYALAYDVGKELARAGFVVCTGGYAGIMEASSKGAREGGGRTIGVISDAFPTKSPNQWVDEVIVSDSLINRLMKLMTLGEAYVVLKGGTGTLLEFAAVWEFMNKRLMHEKPIVLVGTYWSGVVETLGQELEWEGLGDAKRYITVSASAKECADTVRRQLRGQ
jgi:uncharacterized protein (TIGR00725 family)